MAWVSPRPASAIFSARGIWDEWLQYLPLLLGEIHALLLLLKGHLTEPLYPHFLIYEIASSHQQSGPPGGRREKGRGPLLRGGRHTLRTQPDAPDLLRL